MHACGSMYWKGLNGVSKKGKTTTERTELNETEQKRQARQEGKRKESEEINKCKAIKDTVPSSRGSWVERIKGDFQSLHQSKSKLAVAFVHDDFIIVVTIGAC